MKQDKNNPASNQLPPGLTEAQVTEAVLKSGYPLQSVVAELLRPSFGVLQEWSYIDTDTEQLRALDLIAEQPLYPFRNDNQPRIRPALNFLIECKQSDLPFVFFISPLTPLGREFPLLAGLFRTSITVTTDDDLSTWTLPILNVLELHRDAFVLGDVKYSMSFSKCVRKGSSVELSGTEAFQSLVLPLVKALRYFRKHQAPPNTAYYFDCHLTLAVAVLDAPMIGVNVSSTDHELIHVPWVRIARHESVEGSHLTERSELYAIDVVHKDYFNQWVESQALVYARKFAEKALRHQTELATGQGFIAGMGANSHYGLESRLRPRVVGNGRVVSAATKGISRLSNWLR